MSLVLSHVLLPLLYKLCSMISQVLSAICYYLTLHEDTCSTFARPWLDPLYHLQYLEYCQWSLLIKESGIATNTSIYSLTSLPQGLYFHIFNNRHYILSCFGVFYLIQLWVLWDNMENPEKHTSSNSYVKTSKLKGSGEITLFFSQFLNLQQEGKAETFTSQKTE